MRGNPGLDLAYTCERAVPPHLQFPRDQPVLRIDGVLLPECPIGAVARRLEVAPQRITTLIAAAGRLCFGLDGRSYRSRSTTRRRASSMASSTRNSPNAMQRGSPLSSEPRQQE